MTAAVRTLEKKPDADVVEFLREILAKAEAGEVRGVLIVAQDSTEVTWRVAGIEDRFRTIGYLTHAIHQLQED